MATKDFDAMLAAKAGIRPTFKAGGQTFTVRSRIPYKRFQKIVAMMQSEDVDEDAAMEKFFRAALIPEDRQRFLDLLNYEGADEDAESAGDELPDEEVVDNQTISDLTEWLLGVYSGKAETNTPSSPAGYTTTGQPQNVVSLNARGMSG